VGLIEGRRASKPMLAAMLPFVSAVPVSASPILDATLATTQEPNVISYSLLPASEVAKGGAPADGLIASLSTTTPVVKINHPVVLAISVANTSTGVRLLYESSAPCGYRISITDNSSDRTSTVQPQCFGDVYSIPVERLQPGMATLLTFKFDNTELIGSTGSYTLRVRSVSWYPAESM